MTNPPPSAPGMDVDIPIVTEVTPLPPPPSTAQQQPSTKLDPISERQLDRLVQQGYTQGLARSLNDSKLSFFKRIWIVDNSGSMQKTDGHKLVDNQKGHQVKQVPCSRWEEIQQTVEYHIQLAAAMKAPTVFRLLNHPGAQVGDQQMSIAVNNNNTDNVEMETHQALAWIQKARPAGVTPLTSHILEIKQEVTSLAPTLRASGQRIVVCICTDGLPTDERGYGGASHNQEFVQSLRSMEGLPLWIIIRLCTDDDQVVDFYNNLDEQLELSIEVLDDFREEAKEVHKQNPWLNYGLPIHRMRENGYHDRVFDLMDERALTKTELRDFFFILFGRDKFDGVPDPNVDWKGFYKEIKRLTKEEKKTWNPNTKSMERWVDYHALYGMYGEFGGCTIT